MLKVTLVKSVIGSTPKNRATAQALGLRKTNRSAYHEDNPVIRGMIHRIHHLVVVTEVDAKDVPKGKDSQKDAKPTVAAATAKKPAAKKAATKKDDGVKAESPKKEAAKKTTTKKAPAKAKASVEEGDN